MLTVLFATRNRSDILRDVLTSFSSLQAPEGGWKLIIADNGSTDSTREVVESFRGALPLEYIHEPRPGKNYALNTGLTRIEGDLTVLSDDDVFPRPDWLIRMREAADAHGEYDMFGGRAISKWEIDPPAWAKWSELGAAFGVSSPNAREGPIAPEDLAGTIVGPNMAIRSAIFEAGVRFDPTIGPNGANYAMGSESEILLRLSRQGHSAWHVADSLVEHLVRKEQLTEKWILQRALKFGRGLLRQSKPCKFWFGVPRHLYRDIPKYALMIAVARVTANEETVLQRRWFFNIQRGKLLEAGIMAREQKG